MELLQLPAITDVPLTYLSLVALVCVTIILVRLVILKRAELQMKEKQINAQMDRDKFSFAMIERQHTQMAETNRLSADSIHATSRVAEAVAQNTTVVKESLRDLHDSMREGFKRSITIGEENHRAIANTQTQQDRRMIEVSAALDRLAETMSRQYTTLSDTIIARNTGDSHVNASLHSKLDDVQLTLLRLSDAMRKLAIVIDAMGHEAVAVSVSRDSIHAEIQSMLSIGKPITRLEEDANDGTE